MSNVFVNEMNQSALKCIHESLNAAVCRLCVISLDIFRLQSLCCIGSTVTGAPTRQYCCLVIMKAECPSLCLSVCNFSRFVFN